MTMSMNLLYELVKSKTIKYSSDESPMFAGPGGKVTWMFSFHDFFVSPEALDAFAEEFWRRYQSIAPIQIGGVETSGIPLVIACVQKANELGIKATGFFIRKERKANGLARRIDGNLNSDPIVIVDDAFKTGNSVERARVALNAIGRELASVCTILDFKWPVGEKWAIDNHIELQTFFTPNDFGLYDDRKVEQTHLDRRASAGIRYEPLWHFASPDPLPTEVAPKSAPLLAADSVFFGSDSGILWALNARTGGVQWKFDADVQYEMGIWSTPVICDDKIIFGASNGNLYCLDANSGALVWITPACEWIDSSPLVIESLGLVVVGLKYGRSLWRGGVAAFDIGTGGKVWEHQVRSMQQGTAAYHEQSDVVIVGSKGALLALSANDGAIVWDYKIDQPIWGAPSICMERNMVASASHDGLIRISRLEDGELLFEEKTRDSCCSTPLFYKSRLFCGSADTSLYVIDVDDLFVERVIPTRGRIYCSPSLVDGNIVFGNSAGVVEELNGESLETEHAVMFPDAVTNKIAVSVDQKTLYIPTYMNEIYAVERHRDQG